MPALAAPIYASNCELDMTRAFLLRSCYIAPGFEKMQVENSFWQ